MTEKKKDQIEEVSDESCAKTLDHERELDQYDEAAAIEYNKSVPRILLQRAQALFGIDPDGLSGPVTARATWSFQGNVGLPETGKLDDATLEQVEVAIDELPWDELRLGVWSDIHPRYFARKASSIATELARLQVDFVQLMLNKSGQPDFVPQWKPRQIQAVSTALSKEKRYRSDSTGISVGFTIWAYSSRQFIRTLEPTLPSLSNANKANWEIIEPDSEGYVSPRMLRPRKVKNEYGSVIEFNEDLDRVLSKEASRVGARLGTTPHRWAVSGDSNKPRIHLSSEIGGRLTMQAYSEAVERNGKHTDPYSQEGPAREQHWCIKRAVELMMASDDGTGEPVEIDELAIGIPLFDNADWEDGRDGAEAIELTAIASLARGVTVLCGWSLKRLVGALRSPTAVRALELIADRKIKARGGCK